MIMYNTEHLELFKDFISKYIDLNHIYFQRILKDNCIQIGVKKDYFTSKGVFIYRNYASYNYKKLYCIDLLEFNKILQRKRKVKILLYDNIIEPMQEKLNIEIVNKETFLSK